MTHLVGLSGSLRAASKNTLLLNEAARAFAPDRFTLADLRLPLFDEDMETAEGIPAQVAELADLIASADAVIVATPEYNKMLSGVLKNALDWVSRVKPSPWKGKPVAVMTAAAGRTGGESAQTTLRHALTAFRPRLITGPAVLVANAGSEFDAEGRLMSERYLRNLTELMTELHAEVGAAARLAA